MRCALAFVRTTLRVERKLGIALSEETAAVSLRSTAPGLSGEDNTGEGQNWTPIGGVKPIDTAGIHEQQGSSGNRVPYARRGSAARGAFFGPSAPIWRAASPHSPRSCGAKECARLRIALVGPARVRR